MYYALTRQDNVAVENEGGNDIFFHTIFEKKPKSKGISNNHATEINEVSIYTIQVIVR